MRALGQIAFSKVFAVAVGLFAAVFAALLLLWMFGFGAMFLNPGLLSEANPLGLMAIFAILVFGGFYLLNAGFETIYGFFRR